MEVTNISILMKSKSEKGLQKSEHVSVLWSHVPFMMTLLYSARSQSSVIHRGVKSCGEVKGKERCLIVSLSLKE